MSIYTKSKTSASNLETVDSFDFEDSFKVGIRSGAENIIIDYLTNLYADPATACVRELFTNASDASDGDLPVVIEIEEDGDDKYSFTITDYGCGMSAKQLKENYVTYAASTKTNDFDSIGSFGLGSKSPMALVPTYKVISDNGSEQNEVVVSRTNSGIYAKIKAADTCAEHSFTKVIVSGINRFDANRMYKFVSNNLVPFSKQPIQFSSCFIDNPAEDYNKFFIGNFNGYDFTLYSKRACSARNICKFFVEGCSKFNVLVRINNIVYNPNNGYSENKVSGCYVVVDVEPGYFAFAPSRETLPEGSKLSHLLNIVNSIAVDVDWFVNTNISNSYLNIEDITNLFFLNHKTDMLKKLSNNPNCSKEDIDKIKKAVAFFDSFEKQKSLSGSGIEIRSFHYNTNTRKIFGGDEISYSCFASSLISNIKNFGANIRITNNGIEAFNRVEGSSRNYSGISLSFVNVILDAKRNRSKELCVPAPLRINAYRGLFKNVDSRISHTSSNTTNFFNVFVDKGAKIPDFLSFALDYANVSYSEDGSNSMVMSSAKYHSYKEYAQDSTKTAKKKIAEAESRTYFIGFVESERSGIPGCKTCQVAGSDIEDSVKCYLGEDAKPYFCFAEKFDTCFINSIAEELEQTFIILWDAPLKLTIKYLESLGYKYFDLEKSSELCSDKITLSAKELEKEFVDVNNTGIIKRYVDVIEKSYFDHSVDLPMFPVSVSGRKFKIQIAKCACFDGFAFEDVLKKAAFEAIVKFDVVEGLKLDKKYVTKKAKPLFRTHYFSTSSEAARYRLVKDTELVKSTLEEYYSLERHIMDMEEDLKKSYLESILGDDYKLIGARSSSGSELIDNFAKSRKYYADTYDILIKKFESSKEAIAIEDAKKILRSFKKYRFVYDSLGSSELDMVVRGAIDKAVSEYNSKINSIVGE